MNKKKIVTIGGGSGMPVINRGLILAGGDNIVSIVTTFDSGGDSGRMRTDERGRILAFSDYWRSLMSLWPDEEKKELWAGMLSFRDGRGRNFGNMFFQFMSEKLGSLNNVDKYFDHLVGVKIKGWVVPVSLEPANICFETVCKKSYCGEHRLDDLRMSFDMVDKAWIEPQVRANAKAIKAILEAEVIIICPGSFYGSVLINFLPSGIAEAMAKTNAQVIFFSNIMSTPNESHGFCQYDYVKLLKKYLGAKLRLDMIVMADLSKLDRKLLTEVLKLYSMEHSFPIKHDVNCDISTVVADLIIVDDLNFRLRHSAHKVAGFFRDMF